ncbi:MAG: ABC transporter substrate-binding protein, partial [Firmicutes bacterium]|nr:ABC transporter substrate-binding protein [Bacillota bacterium]
MKRRLSILFIFIITIFSIVGCSETETKKKDLMKENWDSILKKAKGETVNIHMWGGNVPVNKYIDKWVSPQLKEQFDITLNRVPINDAKDMINKLLTEKEVNKTDGSIDIFWINGENFKNSKDNGLLWGSFAEKLPNYNKYVDKNAEDIKYDFGELTEGMEVPWGKSQFVLIYDSEKIKNPPINMLKLKEWVKKNKGKFTYPAPPDFTGSAFIRQVLYEETGGYEKYLQSMNANEFIKEAKPLWNYLNEIKPFLWREGKTYPESSGKLDRLYGNGEVWMT